MGKLQELFENGLRLVYKKHEVIIRGEFEPAGIYRITDGLVSVYSINDRGETYVHVIYRPGDIFPLLWVLEDAPRMLYYESLGTVTVRRVSRDILDDNLRNDAGIAYEMLSHVLQHYTHFMDRIDNLEHKFARERVVYRLLFLAGYLGTFENGTYVLHPALTRHVLASSINVSRETFSRELERLERKGYVSTRRRAIVLQDVAALTKELPGCFNPTWLGYNLGS